MNKKLSARQALLPVFPANAGQNVTEATGALHGE